MKRTVLLLILCSCLCSFLSHGQNLIPNGDFSNWPDGQTFPSNFASGSSHVNWISRVEGRGGAGYAAKLYQPSDNHSYHRRIRANKITLQEGNYNFSAWFKGVGTIRWIKVNKTADISGDGADLGVNILSTKNISANDWEEVRLYLEVTEAADYFISVDFFKTTDDARPFLLDDLSLERILPGASGTILLPTLYSGLMPGQQLITFGMKGKGSIDEIGFVNVDATGNPSDTIVASSNLVGGKVDVTSNTNYRATFTIPEGNAWSSGKVYVKLTSNQPDIPAEEAFTFKDVKVDKFTDPKPIAVYLKNIPAPRIGTDTDEAIIQSLKEDGFYVLELDCSSYPTTSPDLEKRLTEFHLALPAYLPTILPPGVKVTYETVVYVPEGYRVAKNVWVWNIQDYGAENVLDYVLDTYNNEMVTKYNIPKVASAADMKDRNGLPISYDLHMDIIYPSGTPAQKVPLLLNFSSNTPRFYPFAPVGSEEVMRRAIYPLGFLTSGYAFINLDHCYNPLARKEHYGHFERYSLDSYNGVAYYTSALRFIHSVKETYNLNGKIGTMGISKASYGSMIAGNAKNDQMTEYSTKYGSPNPVQPYQGHPSHVTVCYTAVGAGTGRLSNYLSDATVPTFTSIGKLDKYTSYWDAYPGLINNLNAANNIFMALWMEELGHTYPVSGVDFTTGMERYTLFKTFFDKFLKPEEHVNPEVYYILPKEGATDIREDGTFRTLLPDDVLPADMMGLSPFDSITVRFLSPMNTANISNYLKIVEQASGQAVDGTWVASISNTCFKFVPALAMEAATYKLTVLAGAEDVEGNTLQTSAERTFMLSGQSSVNTTSRTTSFVFSNPVNNKLYFTSDNAVLASTVYDMSGSAVLSVKRPSGFINTSALVKGVYVLDVQTAEGSERYKIIKE